MAFRSLEETRPRIHCQGDRAMAAPGEAVFATFACREARARASIANPRTRTNAAVKEKSAPKNRIERKQAKVRPPILPSF